jgi:hypothetical protein
MWTFQWVGLLAPTVNSRDHQLLVVINGNKNAPLYNVQTVNVALIVGLQHILNRGTRYQARIYEADYEYLLHFPNYDEPCSISTSNNCYKTTHSEFTSNRNLTRAICTYEFSSWCKI